MTPAAPDDISAARVVALDGCRMRRDDPPAPPPPRSVATGGSPAAAADPADAWLRRDAARKAALAAEVATLPAHRRPQPREFGRCDQAAAVPFRAMRPDEAGGLAMPDPGGLPRAPEAGPPGPPRPNGYMPDAFWHSRRELGASVARAVGGEARARFPDRAAAPPPAQPPLVTATREGARIVVAAACPQARAAGIAPGMAVTLARAMLPALDVREADRAGDAAALAKLAVHAARRWSPIVAVDDSASEDAHPDGLLIDMSAAPLFGGERAMCRHILRWLARRGYRARIAVAGTCGAAHALARHGRAPLLLCLPGREADALAPLPPVALRVPLRAVRVLARLGVTSIGALAAMPRGPLARRFGAGVVRRMDQALGDAAEPLVAVVPPETPQAAVRLAEPIATADPIARVIDDLCAALATALREQGAGARRVALVCRRVDGSDVIETIGTARATRDAAHLARLLHARIERIDPGFGIEAARLIAFHAEPLAPQPVGGDLSGVAPDLAELVDLIAGRIGARRLYRLGARESDVPERSLAALGPLGDAPPPHPRWPRPIRLIDPPERVDHVLHDVPDAPPRRFVWRGRTYLLPRGDGPERVYGEWWRREAEVQAVRDYYRVEAEDGQRFWLFRRGDGVDARTGDATWHVQGVF